MNKQELLALDGEFTWLWGQEFFIETTNGNFIWNDPDHNGDNTITAYFGTYAEYLQVYGLEYGRSKGSHTIGDYCGNDIVLKTRAVNV